MKKLISVGLAALLSASVLSGCGNSGSKELNIFTWDGYIPQDVMDAYTAETGVKINMSNFESEEEMYTKLKSTNGGEYDIIIASDYIIDTMVKEGGLLSELDKEKIPNYANIDESFLGQFCDPENKYTVPYGPGSPLLVYNPETCPVEIKSYEDLWNPELKDSLVVMDSNRVVLGMGLKTMGKSFNETDPAVLEELRAKMMELKPNIRVRSMNNLQDVILSGEACAGFLFTSQVVAALNGNPNLKAVYPAEGLGYGADNVVVTKNAPNKDNAFSFINYILDGEVSAKIYPQIGYVCPNKAAAEFLPEEYKSNPALFIPSEIMATAEAVQDVGEAISIYDNIWTEFCQ